MSVSAIVFVECEHGKSMEAVDKLKKIGGVEEAYQVTGNYDIIAFVRASNVRVLGDVVVKKIQKSPSIIKTITNIVID